MKKGRAGTTTHDYKRHGTTTLFAAMNVRKARSLALHAASPASGVHSLPQHCRAPDPTGKSAYALMDNYAIHKHSNVIEWLRRHPRWTFHFTRTSASWINAVEGFFAILTKWRLKPGVFKGVVTSKPQPTVSFPNTSRIHGPVSPSLLGASPPPPPRGRPQRLRQRRIRRVLRLNNAHRLLPARIPHGEIGVFLDAESRQVASRLHRQVADARARRLCVGETGTQVRHWDW
ncbi:MAG: transposase [Caulobacteraceae bacterium]